MSSVLKPVGPEDSQVYWKRRALVAGIVVLVLLILFLIFRPKGGDEQQESAPVTPSPSISPSPAPSASGSPSPSATAAGALCPDSAIEVTVTPNQQVYKAGEDPQLSMAIANTGATSCQRDIGSGANEITISSGGVQVWSSDDCTSASDADVQTLGPGEKAILDVTWDRTKSEPGCAGDQAAVPAGSYDAVGRNDKVTSEKAPFTLQ